MHCQNNLVPALLEQKFTFIFEEHNITTLINKWNDLNLSRNQLDLTRCILPKMKSITPRPNGRLGNTEHVKSTYPYTDPPPLKGTQLLLVPKYSKKIKYVDIAGYYYPSKLPVTAKCEDVDHVFGKGFLRDNGMHSSL